jgi:hypothetical protein
VKSLGQVWNNRPPQFLIENNVILQNSILKGHKIKKLKKKNICPECGHRKLLSVVMVPQATAKIKQQERERTK